MNNWTNESKAKQFYLYAEKSLFPVTRPQSLTPPPSPDLYPYFLPLKRTKSKKKTEQNVRKVQFSSFNLVFSFQKAKK